MLEEKEFIFIPTIRHITEKYKLNTNVKLILKNKQKILGYFKNKKKKLSKIQRIKLEIAMINPKT